jgi:Flp pilus assembly protein TadG
MVEFAMILPILAILLVGVIEAGLAFKQEIPR